ncbi:unnamed protein product [Aspergillus oryzae var. brunneus]|uniref:Unnamed protein product n=2 Tax=Aspergillus oryzae TaxID=5062 RepID=A0AAN4YPF1_ASPOZ|nr:unnamed protein product [Aspergillus oryzae]GMG33550.1 unnamed protein product [Aspergillus oryzae]GMG48504.1 unnamed protein product [Aspergillus oryzae var. brunneus]
MPTEDGTTRSSDLEQGSDPSKTINERAFVETTQWDEDDPAHPFKRSLAARWLTVVIIRKETGNSWPLGPSENNNIPLSELLLRSIVRPIMLLTLEPMCLNLCVYSALLLGILYLFFGAFQIVFESVYGFELWQRGLTFLGLLVGMVLAILSDPFWRRNYQRLEKDHQNPEASGFDPEWRLPPGTNFP